MSPNRRLTIKDIARSAGLSTAAVSHALRPRADSNIKLSADTIEKIRKVALELNYQPHAGARSIRSNRFHNIGYFVAKSGLMTNTPGGYLAGVHDIAEQNGFRITLIRLPVNIEEITSVIPSVFSERNLDAIVIESYSELAHQIYDQIRASRLPVIFINDRNENNSVYVDDVWGATELTEYMIGKGYGRICFLQREIEGGPPIATMHHSAADRADGYRKAMRKAKRKPEFHTIRTTGVAGLDVELREDDWQVISQYDAVIAYDDDLANLVARAAYDRGLWIPDSLAIAGFNGDYGSLCAWQRLTTVTIPSYEMGCKAAEMAVQLIGAGLDPTLPSSAHRPTLVPGKSA